jgi:hypothetical protein
MALELHYAKRFGHYFAVIHEKTSKFVHLDVYVYGASPERPYVTLATSGMAAADPLGDQCHPTELVTYLPADWDFRNAMNLALISSLLAAARYPHEEKQLVTKHHTFRIYDGRTNLAEPILPGSILTH